jgi:hypothetical protein
VAAAGIITRAAVEETTPRQSVGFHAIDALRHCAKSAPPPPKTRAASRKVPVGAKGRPLIETAEVGATDETSIQNVSHEFSR